MESLRYAFFISESEAPYSSPRILNGSNIWTYRIKCLNYVQMEIQEASVKVDKDGAYNNAFLRPMELELLYI